MSSSSTESLNLVFDADDTLWDSNIHFLEAFDCFAAAVGDAVLGISRVEIQAAVRRAEMRLIKTHGYGRRPYLIALHQAAAELGPAGHDGLRDEIERIGVHLLERESEREEAFGSLAGKTSREALTAERVDLGGIAIESRCHGG